MQSEFGRVSKVITERECLTIFMKENIMRKVLVALAIAAVLAIPTVAQAEVYEEGSCSAGNFSISFSNATFTAGIGWSTGSARTVAFQGSCNGCSWGPGVYGWWRNPLVEYYIGKSGGSSQGSYSCDGTSYTLYVDRRYNQPSIDGYQDFDQYNCSGQMSGQKDMSCHFNAWSNMGRGPGNHDYMIVSLEGFNGNSGSGSVGCTGSNWYQHWNNGGSSTFNCGGGPTSSSTTTTSGYTTTTSGYTTTTSGTGSNSIVVRARGTNGSEHIYLSVGGSQIASWTLSTSMSNYSASTNNTGGSLVCFDNDQSGRDVQVDYITVNGSTRQAENQSYNTGVWQDGSCGGEYSEWLHCNGCIGFGDIGGGGSTTTTSGYTTTTTSGGTTTTTSSWWWGGGGWWW